MRARDAAMERLAEIPAETLIDLGKEAIDWWMPQTRPTTKQWEELLDDLDPIRELVVMIERLAEAAPTDSVSTTN